MPYGALGSCITPDSEDRAKASGLRMMFANVSSMITVIIAVPLMRMFSPDGSATHETGYFWAVLITCLLGLPTMIISGIKTREVVTPPPTQKTIPVKAQMKALVENRPVAAIIGTGWLGDFLFMKFKHKGIACAVLNFITGAAYIVMFFTTAPSLLFWILTFIGSMSFYAYMGIHFGTIGDAVDYGEYISGVRCDGFLSAFVSVANKAGGAVMPAIGVAVLGTLNYVAKGTQSTEVLTAINCFISMIPGVISIINGVLYLFYPISTEKHKEIIAELISRREV